MSRASAADLRHCFRGNGFCLDCGRGQLAGVHDDAAPSIGHYLYAVRIPGLPDSQPVALSAASNALGAAFAAGMTGAALVWVGDTSGRAR